MKLNRIFLTMALMAFTCAASAGAQLEKSLVTIYCKDRVGSSQGTGFILGNDGLIVTAYHVVQDSTSIDVRDAAYKSLSSLTIQYIDPGHDIAILKTSDSVPGLSPITDIQPKQTQIVIEGSPRGTLKQTFSGQTTSDGPVDSLTLSTSKGSAIFAKSINIYTIDITVYSGMSGAPIVNSQNQVIGILSGSYDNGRGLGWAIPISYALNLLAAPARSVPASQVHVWPALTVMAPSFISIKRSFSKTYDSEHITQLEILESILPKLKGTWTGQIVDKTPVGDNGQQACKLTTNDRVQYRFDGLDLEKAAIIGSYRNTIRASADISYVGIPNYAIPLNDFKTDCAKAIFNKDFVTDQSTTYTASVKITVDDVAGFADKPVLNVNHLVTDCTGDTCSAADYGQQEMKDFEIIGSKIRWGDFILIKSSM